MSQAKKTASAVKKKPLSWDDLHTLATLAKARAYAPAAALLKLSRGTVVRRIERLEKALGLEVVEERMGEVHLTAEGRRIVGTAMQMQDLVATLSAPAPKRAPQKIGGKVRITAPEGIAAHLVVPLLAQLQQEYPDLCFDLLTGPEVLSISHKEADIGIRTVYPTDGNLVAVPVGQLSYSLYSTNSDTGAANWIAYDDSGRRFRESAWLSEQFPSTVPRFQSNSLFAQIQAARCGVGAAVLPDYVQRWYPELARLPGGPVISKDIYLVFHGKDRDTDKIRVVVEWLKGAFGELLSARSAV